MEDTTEQFSADEEEELGDDPLHCEDPVMHISGAGHWFLEEPVSRDNTPDPDDGEEDHRQFATVLQLAKSVRDQIKALVLDNTNIRAACDDLRRQCHSQGVAFGDLSRLVNRTREDQEETRAYSRGQAGPHPHIRQELLDAEGNLRAQDIGISCRTERPFCMVSG